MCIPYITRAYQKFNFNLNKTKSQWVLTVIIIVSSRYIFTRKTIITIRNGEGSFPNGLITNDHTLNFFITFRFLFFAITFRIQYRNVSVTFKKGLFGVVVHGVRLWGHCCCFFSLLVGTSVGYHSNARVVFIFRSITETRSLRVTRRRGSNWLIAVMAIWMHSVWTCRESPGDKAR